MYVRLKQEWRLIKTSEEKSKPMQESQTDSKDKIKNTTLVVFFLQ